ncbi:hyaluronoglucosaminidase [Saccharopolyspora erythraea NRRL 2338]|nr:beta-N-acetylglucosaminidase domain-containing protein [Saccharopolyspora erythraea]EQD83687.1 Hyaluronidase [Saccharopolyspora erythraea D]PFG93679.1 hyaluronoglucosaminidase [Saccharopolyspora erythraea NRRL 2338]
MCRRIRMAALLGAVALLAGCTDQPAGRPAEETPGTSGALPATGVPQVTPQPKKIERLGDDIAVRGRVQLVVDPMADKPTRDLAVRVLEMAGADEVLVREPGQPEQSAHLTVRLGDRGAPGVTKGLQELGFHAPMPTPPEGYVLAGRGGDQPTLVMGASDPSGAYYAVQTLRQLVSPGRIAGVGVSDSPRMPIRGSIEGFYGSPWTHAERMDQLAFYGDVKLNTYVYAPKDDPYHREQWRDPYPPDKLAEVKELIGQAAAHHVKFTFALSPGNSICYSDPRDVQTLVNKLRAVHDAGVRDFSIPLDDISYTRWNCPQDQAHYGAPSQGAAGRAQTDLLNQVQREFIATHPDVSPLQMVPTEYSDVEDSPYKTALRTGLDPRVLVMWTGDGVIPRRISVADAKAAEKVWGRKVFIWDNYPVNDFDNSVGRLMLGPYAKREPGLSAQVVGDVVNPMNQAAASKVVEIGAADFSWNDEDFDAQRAWRAAAEYLAGDRFAGGRPGLSADPATVDSLLVFFDLEHMAPLASGKPWLEPAPELARRIAEFNRAWQAGDRAGAIAGLRGYAQAIKDAPQRIRAGAAPDFVSDSGPWLDATVLWGDALLATLDGLEARAGRDEARAGERFAAAGKLADQAGQVHTVPGESRPQGPVRVADGVLDVFVEQAPGLR